MCLFINRPIETSEQPQDPDVHSFANQGRARVLQLTCTYFKSTGIQRVETAQCGRKWMHHARQRQGDGLLVACAIFY